MTYIRSGLRERASTSGALAFLYVVEREIVWAGWKKKGFVGHRLPLHAEIPALVRCAMVPVYIVSREKEKTRGLSCACTKNLSTLLAPRRRQSFA